MKTIKFTLAIIVIAFFTCGNTLGQVWHVDVVVSFDEFDLTPFCPDCSEIGAITGTYTYRYGFKLSEAGKIESLHWVIQDCDMHNQNGDKIICIDNGHDNFGFVWDFFNRPDYYNADSRIQYSSEEGWLNDLMPTEMPIEGTFIGMSFRTLFKGKKYDLLAGMVQYHMNANGVVTANVVKP
jgi:hypothetical protein